MIEAEDVEVVVAMIDDVIVGSGYVMIKASKPYVVTAQHGYVGFMYVRPEHRGQGISQKILEELKSWAQSKNLIELQLDVYAENQKAISAYKRFGFEENMVEMRIKI